MNERTRTGLEILQASALIGVLGNLLLRETPWGLNAFLFVSTFVVAMLMLIRWRRPELLTKTTLSLTGAMVFFASMFLFRDAEELLVYNTFAILILMGVLMLPNLGVKAHIAGAVHYIGGFFWSGFTSFLGVFPLMFADIEWGAMPSNAFSRHAFSVLRGIAIALPLLLIFGGLFMAADAAFEGLVNRAVNFDLDIVISHVIISSVLAWLTAGYFRGAFGPPFSMASPSPQPSTPKEEKSDVSGSFVDKVVAEPAESSSLPNSATVVEHINRSDAPNAEENKKDEKFDWQNIDNSKVPTVFTLGKVETIIILGLVDLLFLTFVAMQLPYLFGGMDLVQNTPHFKLADYARRGFGELVAVAAIVLPVLLASHWLLRRDGGTTEKIFKILAGIQIALLFVIMASAVQRLVLLTGALGYGLTTVRFYPMVVMIWLAVVFLWFSATVLRGSRRYFAWGALWSAILILGVTNLVNPHAFIARHNLDLMEQGREFDPYYNLHELSDDAIPALLERMPAMNSDSRCVVASGLRQRMLDGRKHQDLRSWSMPRSIALAALENEPTISSVEAVLGVCPWVRFPAEVPAVATEGDKLGP